MTVINENKYENNEEVKTEEGVSELIELVLHIMKTINNKIWRRGFVTGLLTAVSIQSIITIFIMLAYMQR